MDRGTDVLGLPGRWLPLALIHPPAASVRGAAGPVFPIPSDPLRVLARLAPPPRVGESPMLLEHEVVARQRVPSPAVRQPGAVVPPLVGCVLDVVRVGSEKEVLGIHARWVVATVEHPHPGGDLASMDHPRRSVSAHLFPAKMERPVTLVVDGAGPQPASTHRLGRDAGHETLTLCRHRKRLPPSSDGAFTTSSSGWTGRRWRVEGADRMAWRLGGWPHS
jgi:hypothetical protein